MLAYCSSFKIALILLYTNGFYLCKDLNLGDIQHRTNMAPDSGRPQVSYFRLEDDGTFPNNARLPLIILANAFSPTEADLAATIEACFEHHGWPPAWRNGLFGYHHYHSSAHEALGVYAGWVNAQFGGPQGVKATARAGDVIVIPAGVAHKNLDQSNDFMVVGAYPRGQRWDMNTGRKGERPRADARIRKVPLPNADPVLGRKGAVTHLWQ
jgi:uncharacterized protein YjlB